MNIGGFTKSVALASLLTVVFAAPCHADDWVTEAELHTATKACMAAQGTDTSARPLMGAMASARWQRVGETEDASTRRALVRDFVSEHLAPTFAGSAALGRYADCVASVVSALAKRVRAEGAGAQARNACPCEIEKAQTRALQSEVAVLSAVLQNAEAELSNQAFVAPNERTVSAEASATPGQVTLEPGRFWLAPGGRVPGGTVVRLDGFAGPVAIIYGKPGLSDQQLQAHVNGCVGTDLVRELGGDFAGWPQAWVDARLKREIRHTSGRLRDCFRDAAQFGLVLPTLNEPSEFTLTGDSTNAHAWGLVALSRAGVLGRAVAISSVATPAEDRASGAVNNEHATSIRVATSSESDAARDQVTVSVDRLNVRAEPSLQSRVLASAERGHRLVVLSRDGAWLRIASDNDFEGWVYAQFVTSHAE